MNSWISHIGIDKDYLLTGTGKGQRKVNRQGGFAFARISACKQQGFRLAAGAG